MIHGDVVTMTSEGVLVHGKALQPLGIFDQSICWAVWTANPYMEHQQKKPNKQYGYPNLVVSPIHPSSWPFLLQMEIALSDEEGAFAQVCELLNQNDLSILFMECTTAGFSYAFCNVIAESTKEGRLTELRREKEQLARDYPHVRITEEAFNKAQGLANSIAAEMFAHAQEIEEKLNAGTFPFLHSWKLVKASRRFLYDEDTVIAQMSKIAPGKNSEQHRQYLDKQLPRTATVHYMQRLAYFSLYGGKVYVPYRLRYEANSALLKLQNGEVFSSDGMNINGDSEEPFVLGPFPRSAICIFNSQDKYIRLKPVTSIILKEKLTRIDVDYRVERRRQDVSMAKTSQGFLHLIGTKLENINLLHVANKSTRDWDSIKTGLVSFVADVPEQRYKEVKDAIQGIEANKPAHLKDVSIRNVCVQEYPQRLLFLSLHFGHPRQKEMIEIIRMAAREYGFEDMIVETYTAPTTQRVVEKISDCQAFLQLLLLKETDRFSSMSFSWLDFEYGVASGKGLQTIRLVDVSRITFERWKRRITTNTDQRVREFRSNGAREELILTFREAIGELAGELLRRQQDTM
ncbi:MAG TPA: hypothetical protein VGO96_04125 [Pyrinomonadaceae bacterium]|jgi:hypothetical protein|nr:hypothetical protein [Pyrinomonadaceae bacterium]